MNDGPPYEGAKELESLNNYFAKKQLKIFGASTGINYKLVRGTATYVLGGRLFLKGSHPPSKTANVARNALLSCPN